jgi:hypothetical protein
LRVPAIRLLALRERLSASVRFRAVTGRPSRPLPPLGCANRDRTQRSKIPYHLVGAAERRKWDYRYIPDLDRIQDAAAEPAKKEE